MVIFAASALVPLGRGLIALLNCLLSVALVLLVLLHLCRMSCGAFVHRSSSGAVIVVVSVDRCRRLQTLVPSIVVVVLSVERVRRRVRRVRRRSS